MRTDNGGGLGWSLSQLKVLGAPPSADWLTPPANPMPVPVRMRTGAGAMGPDENRVRRLFTLGRDAGLPSQGETAGRARAVRYEHAAPARALLRRDDTSAPKAAKTAKPTAPDFEKRHGDYYIAGYTLKGVTLRLGILESERPGIESKLSSLADAVNEANQSIADPKQKIKICAIAKSTTRFALFEGAGILVLGVQDANVATAHHELGHGLFNYLRQLPGTESPLADVALEVVDIFNRLAATKPVKAKAVELDIDSGSHRPVERERPAGLWIADPPQWSGDPKAQSEHPWDDADEMFASAREAFLTNPKGFAAAIARFSKLDAKVKKPAEDLVALLRSLEAGKAPRLGSPAPEAKADLAGIGRPGKVEDTLESGLNELLRWALRPESWPWTSTRP